MKLFLYDYEIVNKEKVWVYCKDINGNKYEYNLEGFEIYVDV